MPTGPSVRPPQGTVNHFWYPRSYYHHHHHYGGYYPYYLGTFGALYPFYYPMYYYPDTYDTPGYDDYPYAAGAGAPTQPPAQAVVSAYYRLGHDWGQDLRNDVVTWNQFVDYVKNSLLNAPETERAEFRRGFISGYGLNAGDAFDKAWGSASNSNTGSNPPASAAPPATDSGTVPPGATNPLPPAVEEQ